MAECMDGASLAVVPAVLLYPSTAGDCAKLHVTLVGHSDLTLWSVSSCIYDAPRQGEPWTLILLPLQQGPSISSGNVAPYRMFHLERVRMALCDDCHVHQWVSPAEYFPS